MQCCPQTIGILAKLQGSNKHLTSALSGQKVLQVQMLNEWGVVCVSRSMDSEKKSYNFPP